MFNLGTVRPNEIGLKVNFRRKATVPFRACQVTRTKTSFIPVGGKGHNGTIDNNHKRTDCYTVHQTIHMDGICNRFCKKIKFRYHKVRLNGTVCYSGLNTYV